MKRIAIDLNDVIRDYTGQFIYCYNKIVDSTADIKPSDVTSFDFCESFGFEDRMDYNDFKYMDAAFELHGLAQIMDDKLTGAYVNWSENVLKNLDVEEDPEVIIMSTFELGPTISATLAFLSDKGIRAREYYFPIDSMKIYDRCDILITANPNLIENCPEGKTVFKVKAPYNESVSAEYEYDSLYDILTDNEHKLITLIENGN